MSAKTATSSGTLMDGREYLESLRDGREVYIYGERVKDVTTHPTSRNAARSIARLYDALHDPATSDALTMVDRHGIRTHRFFTASYTAQELLDARNAIAIWARMTYGFMGRTPDYKASFMATLGATPEFYAPYTENGIAWYKRYASKGLFLNHVLINPPVDRKRPVHEVGDVFVHVVKETDGGIVVNGAKMLATGSALTNATFVAQNSAVQLEKGKAEDFALVFIAPMDTPGCKLICRPSYEGAAHSPFDHPLSSRFDENDAVIIFDNAFIPWENVLVYRDIERARRFYAASGFFNRYNLQAGTRLGVKLDLMCGLLAKGLAANGTEDFRGVQTLLGEVVAWRNLIWSLTTAMCLDPQPGPGGSVMPKLERRLHPAALFDDGVATRQGSVRDDPRRCADRHAVELQGSREPRAAAAARSLLPRLGPLGGTTHQALQAHLGCDRHRIRRPARDLRAQLFGQQRTDAD